MPTILLLVDARHAGTDVPDLTALASRPLHGYAVIREVAQLSAERVILRAGTLYAALDRLTEQRLIEVDREEAIEGRLRRYYRLTDHGGGVLATEVERLQHNANVAAERLRQLPRLMPGTAG